MVLTAYRPRQLSLPRGLIGEATRLVARTTASHRIGERGIDCDWSRRFSSRCDELRGLAGR